MKNTKKQYTPPPLIPVEIDQKSVKSHLRKIADSVQLEPEHWILNPEFCRKNIAEKLENQLAHFNEQLNVAQNLRGEDRISILDQIQGPMETTMIQYSLSMIALQVVKAAVKASESTVLTGQLSSEIAEKETLVAKITAAMIDLQSPDEEIDDQIEALEKEQFLIGKFMMGSSNKTRDEMESDFGDLSKEGVYKGIATEKGCHERDRELTEEIEILSSKRYERRLPDAELYTRLEELKISRHPVETRLILAREELKSLSATDLARVEELWRILNEACTESERIAFVYTAIKKAWKLRMCGGLDAIQLGEAGGGFAGTHHQG